MAWKNECVWMNERLVEMNVLNLNECLGRINVLDELMSWWSECLGMAWKNEGVWMNECCGGVNVLEE